VIAPTKIITEDQGFATLVVLEIAAGPGILHQLWDNAPSTQEALGFWD